MAANRRPWSRTVRSGSWECVGTPVRSGWDSVSCLRTPLAPSNAASNPGRGRRSGDWAFILPAAGPRGPSAQGRPAREGDRHVLVPRPPPPRVAVVDHDDERPRWEGLADGLGGPRRVGTYVLSQRGLTEQAARVAAVDL